MGQDIWLWKILKDIGERQIGPTIINYKNKSTIAMLKNSVHHTRRKHIAIKYHFISETKKSMNIQLEYYWT